MPKKAASGLRKFITNIGPDKSVTIISIVVLLIGLATGIVLVQRQQEVREKASMPEPCRVCENNECILIASPPYCHNDYNECSDNADCCTSGQIETIDCTTTQNCPGKMERTCNSGGTWGSWSICVDIADNCPPSGCDKDGECDCYGNQSYRWQTYPVTNECTLVYDPSCVQECTALTPTPTSTPTSSPSYCTLLDNTDNPYCVGNNPGEDCWCGTPNGPGGVYWCCTLLGNPGVRVSDGSPGGCVCPPPFTWKSHEYGYTWCFNTAIICEGGDAPCRNYPGEPLCDTSVMCGTEPDPRCISAPTEPPTSPPTKTPTPTFTKTPTPTNTRTPTPTPTPVLICQNIRAFDINWNELSASQLSQLNAGDKIRFTVAGDASSGTFDMARFRINSSTWRTPVTQKRPGSDEFYDEYTIPAGTYSFSVDAQIHHLESDSWI